MQNTEEVSISEIILIINLNPELFQSLGRIHFLFQPNSPLK